MNHQADVLFYSHTTFFNVSHERCKSSKVATDSNVGSYSSWIGALVSVPLPALKKKDSNRAMNSYDTVMIEYIY